MESKRVLAVEYHSGGKNVQVSEHLRTIEPCFQAVLFEVC